MKYFIKLHSQKLDWIVKSIDAREPVSGISATIQKVERKFTNFLSFFDIYIKKEEKHFYMPDRNFIKLERYEGNVWFETNIRVQNGLLDISTLKVVRVLSSYKDEPYLFLNSNCLKL